MQGTYTTRHARGALLLLIASTSLTLVVGALGMPAQATDPTPAPATASGTPTDASSPGSARLLTPSPTFTPETRIIPLGRSSTFNLAADVVCNAPPCTYSRGSYVPAGWGYTLDPAGVLTIKVPSTATPGQYAVHYTVTDAAPPPQAVDAYVTVDVTPDGYNPTPGMTFSHPFRKYYRNKIRARILRTINSVPTGGRIQVASWSFSSGLYWRALNQARRRGVVVQIVLSSRNVPGNSDWTTLRRLFGTTTSPDGSWVKRCSYSCRGSSSSSGTMHSKIFLFSQSFNTPYVSMTGSANLTDFAVKAQWNQMNTVVGDKAVYDEAVGIFNQMVLDTPASPQYVESHFASLWTYYYPDPPATQRNDFMMRALAPVRCTGATHAGKGGRTIVKIAMYAWYEPRGQWLASRVRQLWNQGCRVQIVYAILSNQSKKILYSPAGRGRIPMRQILLTNKSGSPIYYLHDKWVAITGNYAGVSDRSVSLQGSFNFSNMGFTSDEQFQLLWGRPTYNAFARDFTLLWTDKQARAPSPTSVIKNIQRTAPGAPTLGTGSYAYMERD